MNRTEFTKQISKLILQMIYEGENPVGDYWLRDAETQNRLFKEGKSKCDGYKILSKHQSGSALDIYFIEDGKVSPPKKGFEYWHKEWELRDGKPIIEWDKGHFEG